MHDAQATHRQACQPNLYCEYQANQAFVAFTERSKSVIFAHFRAKDYSHLQGLSVLLLFAPLLGRNAIHRPVSESESARWAAWRKLPAVTDVRSRRLISNEENDKPVA